MDNTADLEREIHELLDVSLCNAEQTFYKTTGRLNVTRLIFVAKLKGVDSVTKYNDVIQNFHNVFDECVPQKSNNLAGGIAFILPSREESIPQELVGFIEFRAETDALAAITKISTLHEIDESRLLLATSNCPSYSFSNPFKLFGACPPKEDVEIDFEKEGAVNVFRELLNDLSKERQDDVLTTENTGIKRLNGKQAKSLPSSRKVQAWLKCPLYPSLNEYTQIFTQPIDLECENHIPTHSFVNWQELDTWTET